ncbi:MAG: hypothetical protein U5R49_26215 [Deltaproteobacteria bacterium]|nr:hypothetical protein [Deltaproteobacteria bacterium]
MKKGLFLLSVLAFLFALFTPMAPVMAAEPIILGVPTSLGFLEGKEGLACVEMAVEEINAAGGVDVGVKNGPSRSLPSMRGAPNRECRSAT